MKASRNMGRQAARWLLAAALSALVAAPAIAEASPITFTNIAAGGGAGIGYRRAPSTTNAAFDAIKLLPYYARPEIVATPFKARGAPGVVVFDYDRDGDLDIYVTNGPGRANSLYQNQLKQGGGTTFVDVAGAAGVTATAQDSTGTCYGDIDNDGDLDLLVLGRMEANRLYRNEGNGTFTDITASANLAGGALGHASCTMGDVNNDGRLDIVVSNTFDWARQEAIFTQPFSYNHANQLYINLGGNTFTEDAAAAGLHNLWNVPPGDATVTWEMALVDYDLDGDLDIIEADDQAAILPAAFAGVERGVIQIFDNDGTGHFTNVTLERGTFFSSSWMGFGFGDFNCDGGLDFFASSIGDYLIPQEGGSEPPGFASSQWFLRQPDGSYIPQGPAGAWGPGGLSGLVATPHGWGSDVVDYDNDGDGDIIYTGNMDNGPFFVADNPGVVLRNEGCDGTFTFDSGALASSKALLQRSENNGQAVGDLNDDGFIDFVTVAGAYVPTTIPLVRFNQSWGSPFDATAMMAPTFFPIGPEEYEWAGMNLEDGYMTVQMNSASNGNRWAKVTLRGSKGTLPNGAVNRDGIGAVLKFTPRNGKTAMAPVLGGASHASQADLTQTFGLGSAVKGTLDVLWPGGVKNRVYNVLASERLSMPEIPCSYAGSWPNRSAYRACVDGALDGLQSGGVITIGQKIRLKVSAYQAYDDTH